MTSHARPVAEAFLRTVVDKYSTIGWETVHLGQISLSLLVWTMISWLSYYFVAPRILARKSHVRSVDGMLAIENTRLKWGHMLVSFWHALVATVWSVRLIYFGQSEPKVIERRAFGYVPELGLLFATSLGYFIWDFFCCIRHLRIYGWGYLIHAVLGICALGFSLSPFLMFPTARFFIFEASTIFIDLHWFIVKPPIYFESALTAYLQLGYNAPLLLKINDLVTVMLYVICRLVLGSHFTYLYLKDLWAVKDQIHFLLPIVGILANCTTHSLNFYWFYKLIRSNLRGPKPAPKKTA